MANCDEAKKNMGVVRCTRLPQMFARMFTTPLGFKIPAATIEEGDAAIQQYLQDAMLNPDLNERIFLWPSFVGFEDAKEDAIYEETPLADLKVRDGKYRWRVQVQQDLCTHRAMGTHNGGNQRVIFYDIENQLFGMDNTDGDFMGFNVSLLNVEKLMISDGSTATRTPIYIILKNSKQVDKTGALMQADYVDELQPLTDVELTIVGVATATEIKATVKTDCDETAILGLVMADFIKKSAAGVVEAITSVTEVNGVYTLVGTAFTTGTLQTETPDQLSLEGYESTPVTVTIV
jgi:hypothetical protein